MCFKGPELTLPEAELSHLHSSKGKAAGQAPAYLCLHSTLDAEGNLPQSENKGCAKIKPHHSLRRGPGEKLLGQGG